MNREHDRKDILAANPLLAYCQGQGWQLKKDGSRWKCLCPLHDESSPSFTIDADKNLWKCFGCDTGGSVIDLHAKLRGISIGDAMRELSPNSDNGSQKPSPKSNTARHPATSDSKNGSEGDSATEGKEEQQPNQRETCSYDYQDATGKVVFQVVRYKPKSFKQCRIINGKRVWNMEGVERLPYHLPELLCHPASVWVVEGERDVETLRAIDQTATCNPGGAGKWLPAFSQYLKGRCVYICPDNDEPGQKHGKEVLKSLGGIVEWVKWIELPPEFKGSPIKDITDLHHACKTHDALISALEILQAKARLIERGIDSRSFTALELESQYIAENIHFDEVSLQLGNWLPALNVRPLGPGDVLGIMAATGQLKTAVVQNILACNPTLPALLFELELSGPLMFERMAAISTGINASEIHNRYQRGERVDWQKSGKFKNLLVCTSNMNMREIDEEIARASAKLGCLPKVFVIDYVQLVRGQGNRYERVSEACEETKRLAKKWNLIAVILSQISRKNRNDANTEEEIREVSLYDGKESGSLETRAACFSVCGKLRRPR